MIASEILGVLYPETFVELEHDHQVIKSGEAGELLNSKFASRIVNEVYIGVNGHTLVLDVAGARVSKMKRR